MIKWLQGSRDTSLLPTLARFLWDPWAGVRVGEASHPGPSGSRATQKKRDYHSQVPASEDAELAKALLAVLHQHSDRQANDNDYVREPPRKKGKGGKTPTKPTGSGLAKSLIQMLESAMVNHWSDTEIIKRMTQKLNQCVEPDKPVLKEPIRKVSFEEFKPTTPVSPTTRRTSAPKDFDLRTPSTKAEQANMNGKGRSAASVTKDPSAPKSRARFACKILPREWTDTPIITSIPKILSSLRDGLPVPGNLLFSADPNVITEVQAIWNAYELKDDFTVAILAPPNAVGPTVSVWWSHEKKKPLPFRYKCTTRPRDLLYKPSDSLLRLTTANMWLALKNLIPPAALLLNGLNIWVVPFLP